MALLVSFTIFTSALTLQRYICLELYKPTVIMTSLLIQLGSDEVETSRFILLAAAMKLKDSHNCSHLCGSIKELIKTDT